MYAILDIEATGGKVGEESIIEIAIYKFDSRNIIDQFISLVNPEKKINYYVQKLTNITDKMVLTAPKFHELAKRIVEITDGCTLVGHNVTFDYRMLKQEFKRIGYNYDKEWIDTIEYSEKLLPNLPSYSLGKLCETLGIILTDRHRASGDARATIALFKILLDRDINKIIIKKTGLNQTNKIKHKYLKLYEGLPSTIGIFYFYNDKDELIYISKSINIFLSVTKIFSSKSFKANRFKRFTKYIKFEETGNIFLATIKEQNEILKNKPIYNNSLKSKTYPYGLYFVGSKKGFSRLEIGKTRKYAPILKFETKAKAQETLEKIIFKYDLFKESNSKIKESETSSSCIFTLEESKDIYNKKIEDFISTTKFPGKTFLIIDKGRSNIEKVFYLVENNIFKGFGYFEYHYQIKNLEKIYNLLIPISETEEIRDMLKYHFYMLSNKTLKGFTEFEKIIIQ